MHKTAAEFAVKHRINLGRYMGGNGGKTGHYFIAGESHSLSYQPTAASAIAMMKRYLAGAQ